MSRTTIAEIARHCAASHSTVSRVLNGRLGPGFSVRTELRDLILETARRLDYRPNSAARSIRRSAAGCVALVFATGQIDLPAPMIHAICRRLDEDGLGLKTAELLPSPASPAEAKERLRAIDADGYLFMYTVDESYVAAARELGKPVVWINSRREADCVYPDERAAAELVTSRLIVAGHRGIAYVATAYGDEPGQGHFSVCDRRAGYRSAMEVAGLTPEEQTMVCGFGDRFGGPADQRVEVLLRLLDRAVPPTAVVTDGTDTVGPLLLAAAMLGRRTPGDLTVATFTADRLTGYGAELYQARIPMWLCGKAAANRLLRLIADPDVVLEPRSVPYEEFLGRLTPPPASTNP